MMKSMELWAEVPWSIGWYSDHHQWNGTDGIEKTVSQLKQAAKSCEDALVAGAELLKYVPKGWDITGPTYRVVAGPKIRAIRVSIVAKAGM